MFRSGPCEAPGDDISLDSRCGIGGDEKRRRGGESRASGRTYDYGADVSAVRALAKGSRRGRVARNSM